jgi:hypothetical protein
MPTANNTQVVIVFDLEYKLSNEGVVARIHGVFHAPTLARPTIQPLVLCKDSKDVTSGGTEHKD